ncbi:esterase-like activity of phytase family protein [Allocoleopsis sp.]|uniref:esterase-like activity of phytase family protein n=1 Tax=Allocoleopsis sp. TaxID=3088169 RepID=UPI002FD53073
MTQLVKRNRLKLQASRQLFSLLFVVVLTLLSFLTTACAPSQARTAEQRTFRDISLDFLGEYQLPKTKFKDTPVGGLSALTYDRQRNKFYALSDDRSQFAPARFYTLGLSVKRTDKGEIGLEKVDVEDVTFLTDENGKNYAQGSIDPEGIALSPRKTVFISSEGVPSKGIAPFIREFDLKTGQQQQSLVIPERYLPNEDTKEEQPPRGIQDNLGFEALTLELGSLAAGSGDPFRLFTATESALLQDKLPGKSQESARLRLMHYLIGPISRPMVVAEHLYLLDPTPDGAIDNGLTELVTVDTGGHFLTLERTYGTLGANAKIYQMAMSAATDISTIETLKGDISRINPVKKKLVLDLSQLGIYLDNLEGMELGPRLPDGSQSLVLVSDDNFSDTQVTLFLLFRLKGLG